MTPRLMLAGTRSGCGKTTFTCALLQAFQDRGLTLMACKAGPDYIDPMFHSAVLGTRSGNLDLFLTGADNACYLLERQSQGCALTVLEGAMGYYDGIALSSEASAWDLARVTETPTVLVVDGRGAAASLCALVSGFVNYQRESNIRGVLLNRVSAGLYPRLKQLIEERCGVKVFGYLPTLPQCGIESRHLGLVTASEIHDLREKIMILAENAKKTVELDGLLTLAQSAPMINATPPALPKPVRGAPTVAVARDAAFCFYYRESLELLETLGARLVFFSPLEDKVLPPCDALWLGGGYPELYAERLAQNAALRTQIRAAVRNGLPTLAECGGFLYLQRELETGQGERFPMCGLFPGHGFPTGKLVRFGYVEITAQRNSLLCEAGDRLRGHEFHYWDVEDPGRDYYAQKPQSTRGWPCICAGPTLHAGFPHIHFYSNPNAARRFLCAAERYRKERL